MGCTKRFHAPASCLTFSFYPCSSPTQVSNDQLRDHVWNLLRAKHFLKWRERHIINFDFPRTPTMGYDFDSPLLLPPKPFTRCVQVGG